MGSQTTNTRMLSGLWFRSDDPLSTAQKRKKYGGITQCLAAMLLGKADCSVGHPRSDETYDGRHWRDD